MVETGRIEYGDFQTPVTLATRVVSLLASRGPSPASVVEPTCGTGAFVEAALSVFPYLQQLVSFDVNPDYVGKTRALLAQHNTASHCEVANFFQRDWTTTVAALPEPILIIGNPPWVTASGLGSLGSSNLPQKKNFQNHQGLDALTGKSNFDVAEWMLLRLLEAGQDRDITLAMLVKTSVARRVLAHAWRTELRLSSAEMFRFDAGDHFGVNADACLLVCRTAARSGEHECDVRALEHPDRSLGRIGWRDGVLVAQTDAYDQFRSVRASHSESQAFRWRSGVKHDCSTIMELRRGHSGRFMNEDGTEFDLEPDYVYPLLKGADLANGRLVETSRWLLVTQSRPGDDTSLIARHAPHTWAYLCRHGNLLDARRSSIYRNRPRFAVFGVGPYTFAPWKVAISALHKRLSFAVVGPISGRPTVFDDTCYHLSCETEAAALYVNELLQSEPAVGLLRSMIFWDAKRPITVDVLQRLSLGRVARYLGRESEFERLIRGGLQPPSDQPSLDFHAGASHTLESISRPRGPLVSDAKTEPGCDRPLPQQR